MITVDKIIDPSTIVIDGKTITSTNIIKKRKMAGNQFNRIE